MADKTVTPLTGSTSQDVGGASYTLAGKFPERFYRRREVCEMVAIASSTLTDYVKQGIFPKPLKLNPQESNKHGSAVWLESELLEWMRSRLRYSPLSRPKSQEIKITAG